MITIAAHVQPSRTSSSLPKGRGPSTRLGRTSSRTKEKDALKPTFDDKVSKAAVINHGDVELIEISEKQDDPSPSKSDPPISPAAKWHEAGLSTYQKVKYEEGKTQNDRRRRRTRSHGQDRGLSPSSTR